MSRIAWTVAVLVGVAFGALCVGFQVQSERARLRTAIAVEAKRTVEAREVNTAVAPPEVSAVPDDREAIAGLRREIEELKRRMEERARARLADDQARRSAPVRLTARSLLDEMVPAEEWLNRGRATPTDAMETALWAAAGGDVGALADLLVLTPAARTKAEALLSQLPSSIRSQCATPEDLVALLGTNDVPLGSAMIIVPDLKEEFGMWRVAQISDGDGKIKRSAIALQETEGNWSLVVPESAIDRYATRLKGGTAQPAGDRK